MRHGTAVLESEGEGETAVSGGVESLPSTVGAKSDGGKKEPKKPSSQNAKNPTKTVVAKQSSQKKSVVAKPEVETNKPTGKFATGNLESYGDEGHVPYRGVNQDEWRIIYRMMPPKKDGSRTITFYYKGRSSYVNKDGKRKVPYLSGGKITTNGTERELQGRKGHNRASD
jgi:hypothetical protein